MEDASADALHSIFELLRANPPEPTAVVDALAEQLSTAGFVEGRLMDDGYIMLCVQAGRPLIEEVPSAESKFRLIQSKLLSQCGPPTAQRSHPVGALALQRGGVDGDTLWLHIGKWQPRLWFLLAKTPQIYIPYPSI